MCLPRLNAKLRLHFRNQNVRFSLLDKRRTVATSNLRGRCGNTAKAYINKVSWFTSVSESNYNEVESSAAVHMFWDCTLRTTRKGDHCNVI